MLRHRAWLLAVVLAAIHSPAAPAQETWRSLGPDGGSVNGLAVDPRDGHVLLAATAVGLFRSTNSGHSWSAFGTGLPGWVSEVAFDPIDSRHLLAATTQGIYRSISSGTTWVRSSAGLPAGFYALQVRALPSRRGVWIALGAQTCGAFSLLARSSDDGATWTVIHDGLPDNVQWLDARPDPFTVDLVHLASNDGLYRSRDGGRSWQRRSLAGRFVSGVVPDMLRPGRLWVVSQDATGTMSQVLVSTDSGLHWQAKRSLAHGSGFYAPVLAIDPARRNHLYFATTDGLFLTQDAGLTWRQVFSGWVTTLVGDRRSGTLTAGGFNASFGVARTQNGVNWVTFQRGLRAMRASVSVGGQAVLWAGGTNPQWISHDDGDSWRALPAAPGSVTLADPVSPDVAYAGSSQGLYRTRDGGQTWQFVGPQADPGAASPLLGLVADPLDNLRLYLLDTIGIYRSDDGADSWQRLWIAGSNPPYLIAVGPGSPSTLYAASAHMVRYYPATNISRSTDNGATWTVVGTFSGALSAIVPHPVDSQRLWVASRGQQCEFYFQGLTGGVSRTEDGGATWQTATVDSRGSFLSSLVPDPADHNVLFATTSEGAFVSRDAGATWQSLADGLRQESPFGFAVRPGNPETLFAATSGGVYALTLP